MAWVIKKKYRRIEGYPTGGRFGKDTSDGTTKIGTELPPRARRYTVETMLQGSMVKRW